MEAGSKLAIFIDDSLVKDKKSFIQINVKKTQQILSSKIETFVSSAPNLDSERKITFCYKVSSVQHKQKFKLMDLEYDMIWF